MITRLTITRAVLSVGAVVALTVPALAHAQPDRIGVAMDVFGEAGQLEGEQWINNARVDESFDFGGGPLISAQAWLLFKKGLPQGFRVGPGVRVYGFYQTPGNNGYGFGIMNDLVGIGEWSIRMFEQFFLVLGGRAGLTLLFPGGDFRTEIRRLQDQGAGVWSVPRLGWIAAINAGLRREMFKNFFLRADLSGQWQSLYLFATDETVPFGDTQSLRFRKYWSTASLRLGLTLSLEVGF